MEAKLEATQAQIRSGLSEPKPEEMLFGFGEFQGFMSGPPHTTGNSSFTALLELPPPQAVELLVKEDFPDKPLPPPPIFPSNFALIDRDSNFSAFALATMSMKQEPLDSDMDPQPDSSSPASNQSQKSTKRKEREKKVKESNKKGKRVEANEGACEGGGEKLPYVHVRARRGQATDSHSLAERARREKINARMKLLQELVPGCNKGRKIKLIAFTPRKGDGPPLKRPSRNSCIVSGTAMVLDEIINHVQALQRQVEFLSMRLAAVDPRIDFNLDALLAAESGSSIDNSYSGHIWPEGQIDGIRQQQYQQLLRVDGLHHPIWAKEEDDTTNFISLKDSRSIYDSSTNSGSLHSSQLKMEL